MGLFVVCFFFWCVRFGGGKGRGWLKIWRFVRFVRVLFAFRFRDFSDKSNNTNEYDFLATEPIRSLEVLSVMVANSYLPLSLLLLQYCCGFCYVHVKDGMHTMNGNVVHLFICCFEFKELKGPTAIFQ